MSDSEIEDDQIEKHLKKYVASSEILKKYGWSDVLLRPYQVAGVNWMIDRYYKGHGCILGDEMGLGKTCQTIAVMAYIHGNTKKKMKPPHLVVCPRSVLENWDVEIKRFAPGLRSQVYIGEKEKRHELAQKLKTDYKNGAITFDILITTYEVCIKDAFFLQKLEWNLLVVDEAHRLKNKESLLYRTISEWDTHIPMLLTGTPVQNNLKELYCLLSFISPAKFNPQDSYMQMFVLKFSELKKSATELHTLLQPYLLRRTKDEVLKNLPGKTEVVLSHGISKLQTKLYKGILTKDVDVFEANSSNYSGVKHSTSLMNILMQLRKCVNHPYLFDGVEPEPFVLGEHLVDVSGKLAVIDKLLKYLKSVGHKVLMFSQMTRMLDVLQDYLGYRGYTYERLDGSVRGEERFLAVQSFNQNDETFVFLLSTRAGGQGINLTSADTVIFVDSDYNPQNDLQAAARAHRIGQTRPVKIIRLIGKNTVEEIILKRAEQKLKLTDEVIKEGQFSLGATKQALFTDEKVKLQDILKYGIDELFNTEEDKDDVDIDFTKIMGPTVGGEWQTEEQEVEEGSDSGTEIDVDLENAPQSMYMFEGTDYSKEPSSADQKAFDQLVAAEIAVKEATLTDDRPSRTKRQSTVHFMAGLPDVLRKPKKKLTPEELADRKKKREENAARRSKEAEEQEMRRSQERRKRRDDVWKKNSYVSCNIEIASDDDDDDDDDDVDDLIDEGGDIRRDIHYVSGDVTHPKQTGRNNNIIVHCADDSGGWGKGGLFTAINTRSPTPEQQYTLAGKMQDLALGDCHLIPVDDVKSKPDGNDWLGLVIAQHRDKRNNLSGIKLSALRYGMEKIFQAARDRKASVHLPRIGHDTPGFNWYGTERLIKKYLASKGIPTYIYYYPRKQHNKRKPIVSTDTPPTKVKRGDSNVQPSTSGESRTSGKKTELLNIFSGAHIYLHKKGMSEDDFKKYKRYIVAYDGDLEVTITERTTHTVIPVNCEKQVISDLAADNPDVTIVTTEWLDDCLSRQKCLKIDNYEIS